MQITYDYENVNDVTVSYHVIDNAMAYFEYMVGDVSGQSSEIEVVQTRISNGNYFNGPYFTSDN
ncbi:hypothetical protein [Anaerobacillus arseniciselenatis]|uniref:hypothetical protein n=1 Tax=Anaerobacillus arseniciselenatis TaxID=85682 RepID=UPI0008F552A4|nr:hypothetical protein [Anaerobacillus arseniciselenatis]